jgi:hypothetical protein
MSNLGSVLATKSNNLFTEFWDNFQTYKPVSTPDSEGRWQQSQATGDLIFADGNAAASRYLVISKSPWNLGTESVVEFAPNNLFIIPSDVSIALSMSQRTLGQEFSVEIVDTNSTLPPVPNIAISAISQTTTVLTVDTVSAHNLMPGQAIGVANCSNPLANYPALVVASIPSPTQITCTAGPGGTIPSLSITNPAGEKGVLYVRKRLGLSQSGVTQIFEQATATQSSCYAAADQSDSIPSGTILGNHSITIGTTASVQAINAAYTYAFTPTNEFRISLQQERLQFADSALDTTAQTTSRLTRSSVCPRPDNVYKLRFRAINNPGLTVPVAQIVSVSKSGSTTATIVFDRPHGLTTTDVIVAYGVRDQTNFANLVTATAVSAVIDATSVQCVWGSSVTATSYGGYVARVNGGNLMSALGALAIVAQSAVLSTLSNGDRQLVLTGSGSWVTAVIGDLVDVVGCRNSVDGATLNVDGPWKVANIATTALSLVLPFTAQRSLPIDFGSTNCGGGVIRRTDLRLHTVRVLDYRRIRIESLARPSSDAASAFPVAVQNTAAVTVSSGTVTTVSTVTAVTTAGTPAAPATPLIINSANSTNGQLVLTGTSGLQALFASNTGATVAYVKLYNKASAPTVGTDTPAMLITVPAAVSGVPGEKEITPGFNGYRFALGLGLAITGGAADSDTTVVAAGQVKVILSRTA